MTPIAVRRMVFATAVFMVGLTAITVTHSLSWIGRVFPGFLVLQNRVVASIALPAWAAGTPDRVFQHEILAVDGRSVRSAEEVYRAVEKLPPGTPVLYTVRAADGTGFDAEIVTRVFGVADYGMLLGSFLAVALAFAGAGCWVAYVQPGSAAAYGLFAMGVCSGLFGVTALDLYGPYWFFRLHVIGETMIGAAVVHLALVFPVEWLGAARRRVLWYVYGLFAVLACIYELALTVPAAYTLVHLIVTVLHGVGSIVMIGTAVAGYLRNPSPLVRRRIGIVAMSAVIGFMAPAVVFLASGLIGGKVPVNLAVAPAVVFPLGIGYAIVQRDLFEIDVFIRRAATYAIVIVSVATLYFLVLVVIGAWLPGDALRSPVTLALPNLMLLFLMSPLQRRVQSAVDTIFFRTGYDAQVVQADLGHALATVHSLTDVVEVMHRVLDGALVPQAWSLFLCDEAGSLRRAGGTCGPAVLDTPRELYARFSEADVVSRYEESVPGAAFWIAVPAEVVVPICTSGPPIALIALGSKGSGRQYTMHDRTFLRAVSSQVALALTNARAFAQLEELNANLELQVHERTAELERANDDLNQSVDQVRGANQQLERSQVSLVRADRLATLGRLAAGIAHEMNTPLAAVQNSLMILNDLSEEYLASIDDDSVTKDDHREIAREMATTADAAAGWARKAAAFLAKVKMHARDSSTTGARDLLVGDVISEVEALLAHRLREADCKPEIQVEPDLHVFGDAGRLGQVLVNLVGNALDACEDHGAKACRLAITARRVQEEVTIDVRDWAGGIPDHVLPRIFDELYTTKEPGRGTGLGLWIARTLIEEQFGGTLTVTTTPGEGSCFTITLPLKGAPASTGSDVEAAA